MSDDITIAELRKQARILYSQGNFRQALPLFQAVIDRQQTEQTAEIGSDFAHLTMNYYALQEFNAGLNLIQQGLVYFPMSKELNIWYGIMLYSLERYNEAGDVFSVVYEQDNNNLTAIDCLAMIAGMQKDPKRAKHFANLSINAKHQQAISQKNSERLQRWIAEPFAIEKPIKPFDPTTPECNVIAYSLWGGNQLYTKPAIINAQLVNSLYPGWSCRFYCDNSVPAEVLDELIQAGAQVQLMPTPKYAYYGLFWRFLVANDPEVDRFLIRDCDTAFSCQERLAVDEWLASDKYFHVIRGLYTYSEVMFAGLWGGVGGILPPLEPLIDIFYQCEHIERIIDQKFLRLCVWPLIHQTVLAHGDFFELGPPRAFSKVAALPNTVENHVGTKWMVQNQYHTSKRYRKNYLVANQLQDLVLTVTTGRSGTAYLAKLCELNLDNADVIHEDNYIQSKVLGPLDASQLSVFNCYGNTLRLRSFWSSKLLLDLQNTANCRVETSHLNAKAGLLDNLDLLKEWGVKVYIVDLHRDIVKTAWSLLNRFDFSNTELNWMFYLNPHYPRIIVDPKPYLEHHLLGHIIWYIHEMRARGAYYQLLFSEQRCIEVGVFNLEKLQQPEGATELFKFINKPCDSIKIPGKTNEQKDHPFAPAHLEQLEQVVKVLNCDINQLAEDFYASGKRLA